MLRSIVRGSSIAVRAIEMGRLISSLSIWRQGSERLPTVCQMPGRALYFTFYS